MPKNSKINIQKIHQYKRIFLFNIWLKEARKKRGHVKPGDLRKENNLLLANATLTRYIKLFKKMLFFFSNLEYNVYSIKIYKNINDGIKQNLITYLETNQNLSICEMNKYIDEELKKLQITYTYKTVKEIIPLIKYIMIQIYQNREQFIKCSEANIKTINFRQVASLVNYIITTNALTSRLKLLMNYCKYIGIYIY